MRPDMEVVGARQLAAAIKAAAEMPRATVIVVHHSRGSTTYRIPPGTSYIRARTIARKAIRSAHAFK